MDLDPKDFLQGAAAAIGAAGAYGLGKTVSQKYREKSHEETGSAFSPGDQRKILDQFTKTTGKAPPNISVNTSPYGASYSIGSQNLVSLNYPYASKFTLGHELGHQAISKGGGPIGWIQTNTYRGLNPNVVGLATVGVGATVPSIRRAASLALGINYLNHSGRILSEAEASRRGTNLLNQAGYPVSAAPGIYQVGAYATVPAAAALGGLAAGRFLRGFAGLSQKYY